MRTMKNDEEADEAAAAKERGIKSATTVLKTKRKIEAGEAIAPR